MIDWNLFAMRVEPSTVVRWTRILNTGYTKLTEGLLLEFAPFASTEISSKHGDAGENSIRLRCQEIDSIDMWRIPVTDIEFYINGKWLNFWQVIT